MTFYADKFQSPLINMSFVFAQFRLPSYAKAKDDAATISKLISYSSIVFADDSFSVWVISMIYYVRYKCRYTQVSSINSTSLHRVSSRPSPKSNIIHIVIIIVSSVEAYWQWWAVVKYENFCPLTEWGICPICWWYDGRGQRSVSVWRIFTKSFLPYNHERCPSSFRF
jgi:hypothetical protein